TCITFLVFALIAAGSVLTFPLSMRVAGGLGLFGLIWFSILRRHTCIRVPALILANWQLLALVMLEFAPNLQTILQLTASSALPVCLPLAFFAAASLFVWQIFAKGRPIDLEFVQRLTLRAIMAA